MVRFFSLVERSGGSTGFVNCNKKLPAIKTNYPMRCLLDLRRSLLKENLSISMQNLIKVFKCEEYQNCTLSEIWNWSRNRKIRHIILSCVPCLCTSNKTSQFHLLEPAESRERNFLSRLSGEAAIDVPDDSWSNRCKRLLPTTVSSSDRSPQTRNMNISRQFHCCEVQR